MQRTDGREIEVQEAIRDHGPAVYSLAARLLNDRSAAEEVAQEVFLSLWQTRPEFASAEHRRRWLLRTAAHRSTDRLRASLRRPVLVATDQLDQLDQLDALDLGGSGARSPRAVLPVRLETQIDELLTSLPAPMRVALVLRYGEQSLTPEEIAAETGQPVATIKSHLQRGLALLRRKAIPRLKEYVRHA